MPANPHNSHDMIAEHLVNRPREVYTSTVILTATKEELITLAECLLHCPFDESNLGSAKDHVIDVVLTEITLALKAIDMLKASENGTTKTHPSQD